MSDNLELLTELVARIAKQRSNQSFFQAVRLLLRASRTTLGRDLRPSAEAIRLRAEASEAFPASELSHIEFSQQADRKPILDASFFGLYGPSGALPQHYTQLVIDRIRKKDTGIRDFLDIFNHRFLSLFYRAWEKHHFPVAYETAHQAKVPDLVTECLMSLVGFGNAGVRDRLQISDKAWLHYAGLKALSGPRPDALQGMISHHFKIPANVQSFQGEWLRIPIVEQTRLGASRLGETKNNALGVEAVAGQRIWAVEHRFRIELGPLRLEQFKRFIPDGPSLEPLAQLVRTYVGPQFEFDVQVILQPSDVPGTTLGGASSSRLGWNTWLGDWRSDSSARDAIFESEGNPCGR
jgi:type VI secretion system protein ImpH